VAEETCPACGHPYFWETARPRACVVCGRPLLGAPPADPAVVRHRWRAAMTAGAVAVLLAGAIVAAVEWWGPARGPRVLMQGLTVVILAAVLADVWRRSRR
jgi:hypothetical protein